MNKEIFEFIPRHKFESLVRQYFNIVPKGIDDFFKKPNGDYINTVWHEMRDYEDLEDLYLLNCLESLKPFQGELFILTDSQDWKPLKINSVNLKKFVEQHVSVYNMCFFNGDVIIISFELKLIWVFHHEALYGLVEHTYIS